MHQATDQAGAAGLTVAENLLLDELCGTGRFFVSGRSIRKRARRDRALIDLDLPIDRDFVDLRPAERQLIAIARAVAAKASVLILDEPTSSLSSDEAERLFAILRRLRRPASRSSISRTAPAISPRSPTAPSCCAAEGRRRAFRGRSTLPPPSPP